MYIIKQLFSIHSCLFSPFKKFTYVYLTNNITATQGSMTAEQFRNISEMGIIPPASCQSMLPLMQQSSLPASASQVYFISLPVINFKQLQLHFINIMVLCYLDNYKSCNINIEYISFIFATVRDEQQFEAIDGFVVSFATSTAALPNSYVTIRV